METQEATQLLETTAQSRHVSVTVTSKAINNIG